LGILVVEDRESFLAMVVLWNEMLNNSQQSAHIDSDYEIVGSRVKIRGGEMSWGELASVSRGKAELEVP
jgi:uncharacterized protein YeaC (DUF1315 family)